MVFVPTSSNSSSNNDGNQKTTDLLGKKESSPKSVNRVQASEATFRMYSDVFFMIKYSGLDENMEVIKHLIEFRKQQPKQAQQIDMKWLDRYFENIASVQSGLMNINLPKNRTITSYLTEPNDCISFYLPGNNCLLMLEKNDPSFVASAFACHPTNKDIYSCDACLVNYPELSVPVLEDNIPVLDSQAFLNQLVYLTESEEMSKAKIKRKGAVVSEDREVSSPILITEWMLSLLSGGSSYINSSNISKKVRSFSRHKQDGTRRSPFWMALKASIAFKFNKIHGNVQGKFLYKCFMLDFMSYLCKVAQTKYNNMSNDYLMQMIIKISLRMTKLENMQKTVNNLENKLVLLELLGNSKSSAFFVTKDTKEHIDSNTNSTIEEIKIGDTFNTKFPKITDDSCCQNLDHSLSSIKGKKTLFQKKELGVINSKLPKEEHDDIFTTRTLLEYELWVKNELFTIIEEKKKDKEFSDIIYKKMDDYHNKAQKFYKNDPFGKSKFILTMFGFLKALHIIAISSSKLLEEYSTGVDITVFKYLLLDSPSDLKLALELEQYFTKFDKSTKRPCDFLTNTFNANSYCVIFVRHDKTMRQTLDKILKENEERRKQKLEEVRNAKDDYHRRYNTWQNMDCEYFINVHGYSRHSKYCSKCSLKRTLDNMQVWIYEDLLPAGYIEQYAIIFELLIPNYYMNYRDAFFSIANLQSRIEESKDKISTTWRNHNYLNTFTTGRDPCVTIGSTLKGFSNTHYSRLHVDHSEDAFLKPNGYNLLATVDKEHTYTILDSYNDPNDYCFKLESPEYSKLEWAINSFEHSQNQVIANQSLCHQNLSLAEFVEYGSMRAGFRLQWHNIVRCLANEKLSIQRPDVTLLLLQTMLQSCPNESMAWYREFNEPLQNSIFCSELLTLLKSILEKYKDNWKSYQVLLVIIVAALRVINLHQNQDIIDQYIKFLEIIRKLILKWSKDIENLIVTMIDSPPLEIAKIRQNLIDINCCAVITFSLEPILLKTELSRNMELWCKCVSRIHDNTVLSNQFTFPKSSLKLFLVRRYFQTACMVEKYIADPGGALSKFGKFYWPGGNFYLVDWKREANGWFQATELSGSGIAIISFNIVRGSFLVNGSPIGRLPDSITGDETYKRVFGNFVFDVQQTARQDFITSYAIDGCQLEFRNNKLIILRQENEESILLSNTIFVKDLPEQFVENYSHWYDIKSDCILFRPVSFFTPKFTSTISYKLDITKRLLQEVGSERYLMNYYGDMYTEVLKSISRIELKHNIHVFSKENEVLIELPRLGLHFELVNNQYLRSKEFSMTVCDSFYCGTLIGLCNVIMLKDENSSKKILLVPNGEISTENLKHHHLTRIDVNKARETPYFTYTVNEYLWQLEANDSLSSWLFLALLHGVTSSVIADPFTKLTGYESALKILKSARCWPMRPLSALESSLLEVISSSLSPIRSFQPKHMKVNEKITWPQMNLPSLCLLDAYSLIVDSITKHSEETNFLFGTVVEKKEEEDLLALAKRNYTNYFNYYNPIARLDITPKKSYQTIEPFKLSSVHSYYACAYLASISKNSFEKLSASEIIDSLSEFNTEKQVEKVIYDWKNINIEEDFFTLYMEAKAQTTADYKVFMSYLGYIFPNQKKLLACCMIINLFANSFRNHSTPILSTGTIDDLDDIDYDEDHVSTILKNANSRLIFDDENEHDLFDKDISTCIKFSKIAFNKSEYLESNKFGRLRVINKSEAIDHINSYLGAIYCREQVQKFLANVKSILQNMMRFASGKIAIVNIKVEVAVPTNTETFDVQQLVSFSQSNTTIDVLDMAKYIFEHGDIGPYCKEEEVKVLEHDVQLFSHNSNDPLYNEYMKDLEDSFLSTNNQTTSKKLTNVSVILELKKKIWEHLENQAIGGDLINSSLVRCGISHRACPYLLFQDLVSNNPKYVHLRDLIGALAVLTALEQQANRLILLKNDPNKKVQYERELENRGHVNWSPKKYPKWLILEIELDLMIRPTQYEVANHMISSNKNMVLQFNMGEGKTSVIIPMLVLAFENVIPRLTVLKQLLETNYNYLSFKLGGILNKKVVYLPFSRDLKLTASNLLTIRKLLGTMENERTILITVPEYRLSFELKGIEKAIAKESIANNYLRLQEHFERHCRDILDESDEILHVRYQLIYTVGQQKDLDMGNLRWLLPQKIMRIVRKHAENLFTKLGSSHVEFFTRGDSHTFPYFRVLDKTSYTELVELVVEDILEGRANDIFIPYKLNDRENIKKILTSETITQEELDILSTMSNDILKSDILLMRGIFAFGLLYHSLNKRWRVNYGVNPNINRLVAVPYRAKDCPSDRAEFGHPDIAIMLTLLSYYYSGLSNEQLDIVFQYLQRIESPDLEYEKWVYEMKNIPEAIKHYKSINLEDFIQKTQVLYPALRNNMLVIDFFLNRVVFSRECKQFDSKISASAWNLCKERINPTCGFSGTKAFLLPITIKENELPSLKGTTGELLKILLSKENEEYHVIKQSEITNFISELNANNQRVLIDVGALMLEMSNMNLCKHWLNSVTEQVADAAVFFNKQDQLVVLDRNGLIIPFEISPYKHKLERCLIYLDDIHTRGTDLKFPTGIKAAVTLGNGLTFERLCQACMRMRLLGKGHSVAFWASQEVDRFINDNFSQQLTIQERILKWSIHNRIQMENDQYLQWATSGLLFYSKEIARKEFNEKENMEKYAKQCMESELFKIEDFYGQERFEQKLLKIFEKRVVHISKLFTNDISSSVSLIRDNINKRAHSKTIFSQILNEEQERELENELEEQRVVERPEKCEPVETRIDDSLELFMKQGILYEEHDVSIEPRKTRQLSEALEGTLLESPINWNHNIYVTDNFLKTITQSTKKSQFFKPVTWLAYSEYSHTIIILSPEEANHYILKLDKFSPTRLLMFCARTSPTSRIMINEPAWSIPNNNFEITDKVLQNLLTDIHIFAGSLYFANESEQDEFCKFLGIAPKPYTPNSKEEELFKQSIIDEFGLISRDVLEGLPLLYKCRIFTRDAVKHLRTLINIRDKSCLFELSHLYNILINNQKIIFK